MKQKYKILLRKYEHKKEKHARKTEEWAIIFQQFLVQITSLKKQI